LVGIIYTVSQARITPGSRSTQLLYAAIPNQNIKSSAMPRCRVIIECDVIAQRRDLSVLGRVSARPRYHVPRTMGSELPGKRATDMLN